MRLSLRVPPTEDVLHDGSWAGVNARKADSSVCQWQGNAVDLLGGLPLLLDAVVNKSHETRSHDNTKRCD